MADKQPNGSEGLYARGMWNGGHGRTEQRTKRQPYELKIPNAKSLEAIEQARTGEGLVSYASIEEMLADLNDDEGTEIDSIQKGLQTRKKERKGHRQT